MQNEPKSDCFPAGTIDTLRSILLSRQRAHSPFQPPPTSLGPIPNAPIMAPVVRFAPPNTAGHLKRKHSVGTSDEVVKLGTHLPEGNTGIARNQHSPDELPKFLARILNQGSSVMSMDFHPIQSTTLLVGTNVGDITLWEVANAKALAGESFNVWDHSACSVQFQEYYILHVDGLPVSSEAERQRVIVAISRYITVLAI